jgi:hypothetical protein
MLIRSLCQLSPAVRLEEDIPAHDRGMCSVLNGPVLLGTDPTFLRDPKDILFTDPLAAQWMAIIDPITTIRRVSQN